MKKTTLFLLMLLLIGSVVGCSSSTPLTLENFVDTYTEAGYTVTLENKPLFALIQATDGVLFEVDGEKVAIYAYESAKKREDSGFEFDAVNGRFGLETRSATAKTLFENTGTEAGQETAKDTAKEAPADTASEEPEVTENADMQLEDFAAAYTEKGHDVDIEEKPFFDMVGAVDGVIFYIDNKKVALYVYETAADLENSTFEYDATNGRFALETQVQEAVEIFTAVGK